VIGKSVTWENDRFCSILSIVAVVMLLTVHLPAGSGLHWSGSGLAV
jgi:hypothetical protein